MEAVLDDLAAALLPRTDITHVVGSMCEGIDCRYDELGSPDDDCFPHLHLDAIVCTAADGSLVLAGKSAVPAAVRAADLKEDPEGRRSDSLGW